MPKIKHLCPILASFHLASCALLTGGHAAVQELEGPRQTALHALLDQSRAQGCGCALTPEGAGRAVWIWSMRGSPENDAFVNIDNGDKALRLVKRDGNVETYRGDDWELNIDFGKVEEPDSEYYEVTPNVTLKHGGDQRVYKMGGYCGC